MSNKKYEDLFFTDDFMFCKIMSSNESICRRVIKALLGIDVEKLTYLNKQETLTPVYSAHGIRLDIIAKETGKAYDIEMQTVVKINLPKRARYYQAIMDVEFLDKGHLYAELPETYIVFICLEDPFDGKLPCYTAKAQCLENPSMNEKVDDKIIKVYYNANEWDKITATNADTRAFLRFLKTQQTGTPLTEDIMEAVQMAKVNEPWRIEFMQLREKIEEEKAECQVIIDQQNAIIAELKSRLKKYEPN